MTVQSSTSSAMNSGPTASGLADVIDTILDKGLVIDAFVRVGLVGIELLTVDARIVVASVDTYLRFAEAANRLDLQGSRPQGLPDMIEGMEEGGAKSKTKGALEAAQEKVGDLIGGSSDEDEDEDEYEDEEEDEQEREPQKARRRR